MKIGLAWKGKIVWFGLSHIPLALRAASSLRERRIEYHWKVKR